MPHSSTNNLAQAAARSILSDLEDAGLEFILNPDEGAETDGPPIPQTTTILFMGGENSPQASNLLQAIAQKGLEVPKDFTYMNLLQRDPNTIESALANYDAQIIIIFGNEFAIPLFPGTGSNEQLPSGRVLKSNYTTAPILITNSLLDMLANHELKKSCWEDLQLAKEIIKKSN